VSRELATQSESELDRLRQSADDAPADLEAELALIRKLRELGRIEEALDRLRAGEDRFQPIAALQAEYAVTLVYLNDRDGAIDRYRRSADLDPQNPQVAVELAMLLLERRQHDDLDRAWDLVTRASELAPQSPFAKVCRAELLALRGDIAGAVASYHDAIRLLPPGHELRRACEERAKTLGP
jgi:Flp pilus assembly protein TadD